MNSLVRSGFLPTTLEVNSLGIGFANISNLLKLDMSDDEYLVVGERHNPTNSQDPLDIKYNMIVNSDGVAVNASRRLYNTINTNLGQTAGLYVDNNIVCAGNIHAKGLVLDNITIADDINSNVLNSFIKQINEKDQPFQTGFRAYIPDVTGAIANVDNIYTTTYLTFGGFGDTFSNSYPLNIVETANNTINNIHVCIKNDVSNDGEAAAFRLGIIGGSNISPAVLSTTEGMPLEFHVSIGSTAVNSLYGNKSLPTYTNGDLPAMTIDARRNVGIGTNYTQQYTYEKKSLNGLQLLKTINTEYAKLHVDGLGVMKDIMLYDYYTKQFQHLDDIYVRANGMTLNAGQIGGGIFNDYSYTFYYDLNVNRLLKVCDFTVDETANVNILHVSKLTVNDTASFINDTYFNDSVFFQQDLTLNKNLNITSGDLFYNGKRVNILDTEPIFLDPSIIEQNNITNNSVLVFAQNDVVNLSGNNITFPGRVGVGIKDTDSYAEQLNVIKRNSTAFELMLQDSSDETTNATPCTAFLGHLTELNQADNSLIINTNRHPTKLNNIYFYPSTDLNRKGIINNGAPVLTIHQNKRIGINIMNPQYELDVAGHIALDEIFVRRNDAAYKTANFLYSNDANKRYFNIYDPLTDRYCINYNYITSTRDLKGFNVRKGMNADVYYENNVLTEQLKAATNATGFYTNKKIALGWANEKISAPLQIRNVTTESNNYSVVRVYRGKRGGGRENNADYSGFDICDFDTDLPFQDRNNFRWFMYKNHLNKIGTDDKKRVGPLQFGYMDNALVPNTFGMTMYYTPESKAYHIDVNNPNVDFGFNKDAAMSVYGDLEVHGNINIIDKEQKGFNLKINGINYSPNAIQQAQQAQQAQHQAQPNESINEMLYGGSIKKNDIVINAEKIALIPNNTTLIGYADDWFLSYANNLQTLNNKTATPLIVYQKNMNQAVARFASTGNTDYIKSSSAIEIGTYNNTFNQNGDIKNMVEFKVSGFLQNPNTLLQLSSFDVISKCYTPFISFYHNRLRTYTHIGNYAAHDPSTGEVFLDETTLHIDDMNKYGIQITNRDDAAAINLHRSYADSNLYYILNSCDDNMRFSIKYANSPFDSYKPASSSNAFIIDGFENSGDLRKGARFGFNADAPSDSFTIDSVYDEASVKITNRYTEKLLFNQVSAITIVNSNLQLQLHDVYDIAQVNYGKYMFTWDNDSTTYYSGIKYVIDPVNIPDIDNTCNIVFNTYKSSSNFIVNTNVVLNQSTTYTTTHNININFYTSNLDISHSKNDTNNFRVVDVSRYTGTVRTFESSNCVVDMSKTFDIIPIIDLKDPNINISINPNDVINDRIFAMKKSLQIPYPNSINFTSNYTIEYDYSNVYTLPAYLMPYNVVVASTLVSLTSNVVSAYNPSLNSNFFNIHNNIHTYLKQPTGQLVDTIYTRHKTYIDTNIEHIGPNGLYNNIFLVTTTSNTILYNDTEYNGNYVAERTNSFNVEASILIPETIAAAEEDRELEIQNKGINIVYDAAQQRNVSNIYFETSTRALTSRPDGLIEIYDYVDRIVKRDIHYEVYDDAFVILGNAFVNKIVVSDYYYVYDFDNWYNYFDDYYNKFYLNINRIRYMPHLTLMNYIDLDNAPANDIDKVHKIYSYDGNFELFLERKEGYKDSILRINEKGDAVIRNSLTTNDLIIDGYIYDKLGNNLLKFLNDDFSNQFSEIYTNKYYLNSCNIKIEPTGSNGLVVYSSQREHLDDINYNIFTVYDTDAYNVYNVFNIQKGGKITINREEDARYDVDIYGTTYSTEYISEVVYTSNLLVYGSNATILTPMYNMNRVSIVNYHEGYAGGDATMKIVSRGQQNVMEVYHHSDADENIAITVAENGFVGINMLEPAYDLDVRGNTHVSELLKTSNLSVYGDDMTVYTRMLNSNFVKISNSSESTALTVNNLGISNVVEFLNNDSNVLTASKKGYIGIGLDKHDPEYVVDICGDMRVDRPFSETFVDSDFYYQFRNDLLLTYDSMGKKNCLNYGGTYQYVDKKNSILFDGGYMMFTKDDWIVCDDLSISGWLRLDGGSDDVILNVKEVTQFIVMMFPRGSFQTRQSSYSETNTAQYLFDDLYYGNVGLNERFGWISGADKYDISTGVSLNLGSFIRGDTSYYGEWIMIDLGELIVLDRYRLYPFNGFNKRMPRSFRVYASDSEYGWDDFGDESWDVVDERDNITGWTDTTYKEFFINGNTKSYRYIVVLIHKVQELGDGYCQMTQMEIFGKTSVDVYNDLLWIKNDGQSLSYWVGNNLVHTQEYIAGTWFHMLWNVVNSSSAKSFIRVDNKDAYYYNKVGLTTAVYPSSSNIYRNYVASAENAGRMNVTEFRVVSDNLTMKMQNDIYNRPVITTVEDRVGINIYEPKYNLDVCGDAHVSELLLTSNLYVYGDDMTVDTRLLSSNFVKIRNESEHPALKVQNYGISNAFEVFDDERVGIVVVKGGNVGINTYYPKNDFEVIGDVHVSELLMTSNLYVYGDDMTVDTRLLSSNFVKITNESEYAALKIHNYGISNVLEVFNEEHIELIVDKAGTVGINTYLPDSQYKLDVNGNIHTNSLMKTCNLLVYGDFADFNVPTLIKNTFFENALEIDNEGGGNVLEIYDDNIIVLSIPKKLEADRNRVGVNVLEPRYTLDLLGDAYISELLMTSNLYVYGDDMTVDSRLLSSNFVKIRNESEHPALKVQNYGTSNAFEVFDDERVGIVVAKGGNVGINTYYPIADLEVIGDVHVSELTKTSNLLVYGYDAVFLTKIVSSNYVNIFYEEGETVFKLVNEGTGNALEVLSKDNSNFTIDPRGFVGINTGEPQYQLEVVGDVRVSQTIYSSNIVIYGEKTTLNTVTYQTEKMEIVSETEGPALTVKQNGDDHMLHVYDDDDIVFTINNTRKVGINMMDPKYDLDVTGDVNVREMLQTSNFWVYGDSATIDTRMVNSNFVKVVNKSAYPALKVQNYGSSNALEVFDMHTNRTGLVVTNDGRVGINTYTPDIRYDVEVIGNMHVNSVIKAYEVQVYGGQIVLQTPTFNSNYVHVVNEGKYPASKINNYGSSNAFEVFNDQKAAMVVTKSGNVGINTYYPKKDFEVIGDVNVSELLQTSNLWVYGDDMTVDTRLLSSNFVKIRNESEHPALKVQNYGTSNAFEVFVFDKIGMMVNNEGRVGINTYAADAIVDINGNVNVSNYNPYPATKIRNYGTSNAFEVFDDNRVGIVIQKGGFVGINTYTPNYDLHIEGTTYSTCLKGDGSNLYNVNFLDRDTSMLVEGSNLYYTAERAGAVAQGSNVHASNLVYNVSNFLKDELDALSRFVDNISLQTGLGNVVVQYDYVPCMHYMFDVAIANNSTLSDIGDGGNVRYDLTIVTAGSAANNTLTIVDGYKKTDVYTEKAYLWTYGNGSVATSANSPYLIYNANTDNLQNILNSFHMCNGFSIHFIIKKNIAVNSNRTCEVLMFANGTNYSNRLIRVVFEGSYLRFYVGSVDFAYTLIDSDVWYIVDLVCKISSDYTTMSLFIYLNGDYNRSMNAINKPYNNFLSKVSTTGLGFLIAYNLQNANYETSSTMYLENMQLFAKAISLEEIDGLIYGIEPIWKGSSGFAPNGSNIYFPYGSVGIGTHNPKADFHVVGNALVELGDLYKKTQVNIAVTASPDIWYNFNVTTGLNPYNSSTYSFLDNGTYGMPLVLNGFTNNAANNVLSSANGYTASGSYAYPSAYTWTSSASGVYLSHTNPRNTSLFLDNIDNTGFTMHFVVRRTNGTNAKIIPIFFVGMSDSGLNMIYVSIGADYKLYFKSRSKSKIPGTDTYVEDILASGIDIANNTWYIVDIVFEVSGGTVSINMFIRNTSDGKVYTVNKVIDFFEKFDIQKILKTGYVYRWETASGAYDDRFENVSSTNLMYAIGYHPKEGAGGTAISISDCSIQDFRIYYDALVSSEIDKLKTGRTDITEVTTSIRENYGVERWKSSDGYYNNGTKFITYTDGNVGIGTTSPSTYNLFIYKATNINNLIRIAADGATTNAIAGVMLTNSATSTTGFSMRYDRTDNKLYFASQDSALSYTNRLTIQGNDGNVGIGKTNPIAPLCIGDAATTSDGVIVIGKNTSVSSNRYFKMGMNNTFDFVLGDFGNNTSTNWVEQFKLAYNASTYSICVTSTGVGIGKSDPNYKLHVEGTLNVTGATTLGGTLDISGVTKIKNANFNVTSDAAGATNTFSVIASSGDTTVGGTLAVNATNLTTNQSTFNLINTNATTVNFAGTATTVNIGSSGGTTNINSDITVKNKTFKVVDATPNDKFVVLNTGATTINFNTTTTPSAISGVVSNASLYVYNNQTAGNNHSTIVNQIYGTASTNKVVYSLAVGNTNTLTGWSIYRAGDVNTLKFNDKWDATGNDRLVINGSDGNVGIGTNDPLSYNLFIYKASNTNNLIRIATDGTTTNAIAGIMLTNSATSTTGFSMRYDRTDNKLYFASQDSALIYTNRLTIQGIDGHIGVNTTTPTSKFHIVHNSTNTQAADTTSGNGIGLLVESDTSSANTNNSVICNRINSTSTGKVIYALDTGSTESRWSIWTSGNDSTSKLLRFNSTVNGDIATASNDRLVIRGSDGYVGIGTTAPASLLTIGTEVINKNAYIHTEAPLTITQQFDTTTTNNVKTVLNLCRQGVGATTYYGARSSFSLSRWEANSTNSRTQLDISLAHALYDNVTVMSLRSNGNVGIGKTDPSYTLHVVGNIGATTDISAFASDVRLKNITSKINAPLKIINNISGFYYKFNEIAQEYNLDPDNKLHVGVSAQDVQSVLPEIVELAPFDTSNLPSGEKVSRSGQNYLTIKYDKLTPVLIEGVKELHNQIETQNSIISQLKDSIEYLKNEISLLKQSS